MPHTHKRSSAPPPPPKKKNKKKIEMQICHFQCCLVAVVKVTHDASAFELMESQVDSIYSDFFCLKCSACPLLRCRNLVVCLFTVDFVLNLNIQISCVFTLNKSLFLQCNPSIIVHLLKSE